MEKLDQLNKARSLLTSALSAALASMPNNRSVQEARAHMKKALNELDNAAKTQVRKKAASADQHKQWWGEVMNGAAATAHQPVTAETQHRSLAQLNKMIEAEQAVLDELEKKSAEPPTDHQLLSD